jgi:hypothetical protein
MFCSQSCDKNICDCVFDISVFQDGLPRNAPILNDNKKIAFFMFSTIFEIIIRSRVKSAFEMI